MDSQQQQQQQMNSVLMRYRSAPSSYYANMMNNGEETFDQFLKNLPYKQEPHENFLTYAPDGRREESSLRNPLESDKNFTENQGLRSQSAESTNHQLKKFENPQAHQDSTAYSFSTHQSHHSLPVNHNTFVSSSDMDHSLSGVNQMDPQIRGSNSTGRGIGLVRQSSSPAGFLSYFNAENDLSHEMGGLGSSGQCEGSNSSRSSTFSSNRLMDFTSRHQPSSTTRMASIPETINSNNMGTGTTTPEANHNRGGYMANFQIESWDDPMNLPGSFLAFEEDDIKSETGSIAIGNQHVEGEKRHPTLFPRHMSLPQSTMEKLLQDSVPFKTRAKRGCATHPRSVAERVRRTKISERIRKLQELVPNMDKQTNTADMLDLAVDYIKDLQRDVKTLTEIQANCTCPHKSDNNSIR